MVLGTLSDGEDTLIAALETCRPEAPRQRCQEHFLGNLAAPVLEVDDELRKWLRDALGGLAAVPTESAPSAVESGAGQPPPIPPFCLTAQSRAMPS